MSTSALKNFLLSLAIVVASVAIAAISMNVQEVKSIVVILSDLWVLQGVVVTAIVTLIYRMQSDIAGLVGLNAYQRARLDEIVRVKARRLWIQFFFIALAAALPRVILAIDSEVGQKAALFFTIFIFSASLSYAAYIPSMWNELRNFISERIAEREEEAERKAEIERIRNAASSGVKRDPAAERLEAIRARFELLVQQHEVSSRSEELSRLVNEMQSKIELAGKMVSPIRKEDEQKS